MTCTKRKGNTFSISLNGSLSKNNNQSETSFVNWEYLEDYYKAFSVFFNPSACRATSLEGLSEAV